MKKFYYIDEAHEQRFLERLDKVAELHKRRLAGFIYIEAALDDLVTVQYDVKTDSVLIERNFDESFEDREETYIIDYTIARATNKSMRIIHQEMIAPVSHWSLKTIHLMAAFDFLRMASDEELAEAGFDF